MSHTLHTLVSTNSQAVNHPTTAECWVLQSWPTQTDVSLQTSLHSYLLSLVAQLFSLVQCHLTTYSHLPILGGFQLWNRIWNINKGLFTYFIWPDRGIIIGKLWTDTPTLSSEPCMCEGGGGDDGGGGGMPATIDKDKGLQSEVWGSGPTLSVDVWLLSGLVVSPWWGEMDVVSIKPHAPHC